MAKAERALQLSQLEKPQGILDARTRQRIELEVVMQAKLTSPPFGLWRYGWDMLAEQRGRKDSVEEVLHGTRLRRVKMILKTKTWSSAYSPLAKAEVDNIGGKAQRCTYTMV